MNNLSMNHDVSYLEEDAPLGESILSAALDEFQRMALQLQAAEDEYNRCKREFDTYRSTTLPNIMRNSGISSCTMSDGKVAKIKQEITCSPNKNDADKLKLAQWLAAHEADHLVKHEYRVSPADAPKLKALGIEVTDYTSVNTLSLKAWLRSQTGLDGESAPVIEVADIPAYIHFYAHEVVEVKNK